MPWLHSWQLNEVKMVVTGQPDRTLQEYSDSYPTVQYPSQNDLQARCVYDDYDMPIQVWPSNHRVADIGPNVVHECTNLPDPDPNLVWVDD